VEARLLEAAGAEAAVAPSASEQLAIVESLSGPIRALIRQAAVHRIAGGALSQTASRLGTRIRRMAGVAARRRDAAALEALEAALLFITGGHTAGEEAVIESLLALDDGQLWALLPALPRASAPGEVLRPRLTGLICFRRGPD
jgi:hypothetical protein